jgi:sugar phosphate isomerase/epimerase
MYDFKIGVLVESFKTDFETSLKKAKEVGAEGIQLYVTEGENDFRTFDESRKRVFDELIKKYNIEVSALCGDLGGHGIMEAEENKTKIPDLKKIISLSNTLGVGVVTTHIGTVPNDKNEKRYEIMVNAARELGAFANENGVTLAIETGPETPETLKGFIEDVGVGVGVNLDPANFAMVTDVKAPDAVKVLGKYIVHTHAKDGIMLKKTEPRIIYDFFAYGGIEDMRLSEYFKEVPLGQGSVLWDEYLRELDNIGYKGFLTIERECGEDPASDIRMAVDFLKRKIC